MNRFQDLTNKNSLRSKIRKRRLKYLIKLINDIVSTEKITTIKICDLGGTYRYWIIFPFEKFNNVKFEITLVNLEKIITRESENYQQLSAHENVEFIEEIGDGCNLVHVKDNAYHLSHSNSVIEHVGDWSRIKAFGVESKRIGKYHFIQTPNFWFPIEPHYFLPFVQFFPRPMSTRIIMLFKKRSFDIATSNFDENRMLSKREFNFIYYDSHMITEWFFFLRKSFIAKSEVK